MKSSTSIDVVAVRNLNVLFHASAVASAAASHHDTYKGMAPGAEIVSAGIDGQLDQWDDVDDAILWAHGNYGVNIMNASFTSYTGERSDDMQWIDRVFDYYVRYYNLTMIAAAGNQEQGNHIGSPAKGYNVIAVGGTDDKNTPAWNDDVIWPNSAWKDPKRSNGTYGDREKPEVVAVAENLTLLNDQNETLPDRKGTSYSAPQVAGLAALLADKNGTIVDEPEAMRAIIMASAIHNVEGDRRLSEKDGAGAIDAAVAVDIAATGYEDVSDYPYPACESPCWWANFVYNNFPTWPEVHFPPGTYRYYYFKASRGERIRVALTWVSNPFGPGGNYGLDPLDTDLDLFIFDPDWQGPVVNGSSASNDNSYELVDFIAPKTGEYKIGVYKKSSTTEYLNWIGLAWTKQATYLPDIRSEKDGWDTAIWVRNDGAEPKDVTITFLNENGSFSRSATYSSLAPNKQWYYNYDIPGITDNWQGSVVLDATEDVSVMVEQKHAQQKSAYTGVKPAGFGDPGWEVADTDLYLPYVYNSYYGYTSQLRIFNPSATSASVTVRYYFAGGGFHKSKTYTLGANGSKTVLPGEAGVNSNFYGSVYIDANQPVAVPVAVIADAYKTNIDISTQAGKGSTTAYLPYIMRQYYGWDSCFVVRNISGSNNSVRITYYWSGGQHIENKTLSGREMWTNCQKDNPNLPSGNGLSAKIESTSNRQFVVAINQSHVGAGKHMSYNASAQPSNTAILANLLRNNSDGAGTWSSGFQVQNAGSATTCVTIKYYQNDGTLQKTDTSNCLDPGEAKGFYLPSVSGLSNGVYSVIITANQPIVAVGNSTCTSCSGDNVYAFNGVNR